MFNENAIIKDWRNIDLSFGLVYPNIYKIGMSSYAVRLLYYLINSHDNFVCERIFLPENIRYPASKDFTSVEEIRSIENKIHPREFDVLGFSIQFENDFKNILWILEKSNIPLTREIRKPLINKQNEKFPLIIGGGPVVTSNPIPFSEFFDVFFIGDSEPNLDTFLNLCLKYKNQAIQFDDFLYEAQFIQGIYLPELNNKVKRSILTNLDESPIPNFQLLSNNTNEKTIFEEKFFIEINRGCPYQCKFCISSFHNFPFRNRSYENITDAIDQGIQHSKFDTISLIGSCVSAHPKFSNIFEYIVDKRKRLSIPSIRIEHITPNIIKIFEKGSVKTITIAPETGSENLRYELGKKISNENILSLLEQIKESNIKNVKLYFLIGLPNESEADIEEIIRFLKNISKMGFHKNSLRVNVNPLVPKLNTPYEKEVQFYLNENSKYFNRRYKKLIQELKNIPSIKIKFKNPTKIINEARLQTLLSLGDLSICKLMINYYFNGASSGALRRTEKNGQFSGDDYFLKIKNCYSPWNLE